MAAETALFVGSFLCTCLVAGAQEVPHSADPMGRSQQSPRSGPPVMTPLAAREISNEPIAPDGDAFRPAPQIPMDTKTPTSDTSEAPQIQLEPPGIERWSRLESQVALEERMRQEARGRANPERIEFPHDYRPLSTVPFKPRVLPPTCAQVEPAYTCYDRLYFEQKNFERGGWDLGYISPFVCAGKYFFDVATLPYHAGTEPFRRFECNAGYCLPGSPVPLLLYPPEFSLTGAACEAAALTGLFVLFPG